jgi:natural product precursor
MKKINLKKLSFKKAAVVALNNQQMVRVIGGGIEIEISVTIFPITTTTSTQCNPSTEGIQN